MEMRRFWWKPCVCVAELSPNIYTQSTKLSFGVIGTNESLCPGPTWRPQACTHTHTRPTEKQCQHSLCLCPSRVAHKRLQACAGSKWLPRAPEAKISPQLPLSPCFQNSRNYKFWGICGRLRVFAGVCRFFAVFFGEQNLGNHRGHPQKPSKLALLEPKLGSGMKAGVS